MAVGLEVQSSARIAALCGHLCPNNLRSLSTHSRNVAGTDSLCRGTSLNLPVRRIAGDSTSFSGRTCQRLRTLYKTLSTLYKLVKIVRHRCCSPDRRRRKVAPPGQKLAAEETLALDAILCRPAKPTSRQRRAKAFVFSITIGYSIGNSDARKGQ